MRQGPNGRRPRGRPNRKQHGGQSRPNNFDSGGLEGRIRGNAHQIYDRYVGLARDALSAGDRVAAEAYYQHAEHYFRILNSSTDPESENRRPRVEGNGRGEPRPNDNRPSDNRPNESRPNDHRRDDGGQPQHQAEARQPDTAAPVNSAPAAGDGNSNDAQPRDRHRAAPQHGGGDREGLDRVLGNQGRPPRRQRRPNRPQNNADAAGQPELRGNGQGHDLGHDAAPQPTAEADNEAPGGKTPGTEPIEA